MSPHEEQPVSPGTGGNAVLKVQVKPVRRTRLPSLKRLSSRLKVHISDSPPVVTVKENVITKTFNRRECCKFVTRSASPQDTKWCKCGHHDNKHSPVHCKQSFSHTAEWNPTSDTKTFPTNAYGEIDFLNAENDVLPLYLRCDMDVKVEDLGNLLLKMWGIPRPNLLISVFGGHSKFDSKKMGAESEVKEGLVKAAKDSKAWVFTSGVDHGVSNLVGDAVAMKRSFVNSIPVIGVNSWGAVYNNHELEEGDEQGRFPAFYQAVSQSELERDNVTNKPKSMVLEHEHTHFILLDFGTKNNFHEDEVRKFRIKLQEHLREITEAQLVSVLIEGGCGSLEEAHVRIMRGLPVVVLGDSGRISNVISLAVDLIKHAKLLDGSLSPLKNDDRLKVRQALIEALPDFEESKYDELMEIVEEIISQEKLVSTVAKHTYLPSPPPPLLNVLQIIAWGRKKSEYISLFYFQLSNR
ncbi:transient receptor potential cation channel subfamily M member-like 2 isoform X3 [Bolinopsis microptera]|uniref:transient receptor potential cation channel subfamily M member-like 2 isoform X3 n=1 Tax=Bolinopsis microptera TaxID=2820187 RepID=UPI003078C4DA